MTLEEALKLRRFEHPCTCGGYACSMNGRNPEQPHMAWCPQLPEWTAWKEALKGAKERS